MPELPEVETVLRGIEPVMAGQVIADVDVRRSDLRGGVPADFKTTLRGRRVLRMQRRGKYILAFLEGGTGFSLHLGMSGRVLVVSSREDYALRTHDHIIFTMKDGSRIVFNDARRFGMAFLVDEKNWSAHESFAKMGPEPLGPEFTGDILAARLKGKSSPIKTVLLDQSVVAGVGNIYACEALHMAGISPLSKASSVRGARAEALAAAIQTVLEKAIASGGSSLRDYHHADGTLGYFQHHFLAYDREGEPCSRCACRPPGRGAIKPSRGKPALLKRMVQSGRSTFYCARCQT